MGSDQKYIPAGAVVEHNCTSDYATCTPQQQSQHNNNPFLKKEYRY